MAIVFNKNNNIFTLISANSLYAFRITPEGYLEHIYYGNMQNTFEEEREYKVNSFSPYTFSQNHSLDALFTEYSYFGSGDLRTTALKVTDADGSDCTYYTYLKHRIFKGRTQLPGLPHARADKKTETLEITLFDQVTETVLYLYYNVFEDYDVISRYLKIENNGKNAVTIDKCMSLQLDLPDSDYNMLTLYGAHMHEMNLQRSPIIKGNQRIFSRRGASSHAFNPFVGLISRNENKAYGFNFVFSGNYLAETEVDQYGNTRFQIGLGEENFSYRINANASFTSPEAIMTFGESIEEVSRHFHSFIRNCILPENYRDQRPVVMNTWEGTWFGVNEQLIEDYATKASACGIDILVIDDGWFGERYDDTTSLGDWYPNTKKFPRGLKYISEMLAEKNLGLGIWIEPEMVSPDSDLYRQHPEWCLQCRGRSLSLGRNQYVLDLSNGEVIEHLKKTFTDAFSGIKLAYIKWDMNRNMSEVGSLCSQFPQKEIAYRYMLGVYSLLEWFRIQYPDVVLETCSGGGGRYDLGMMYYGHQIWTSDNTWPDARILIQYGSLIPYPAATMSCHVTNPDNICKDPNELDFRYLVACGGVLGYEMNLSELDAESILLIRKQIESYKEFQHLILTGSLYILESPYENGNHIYYYALEDGKEFVLFCLGTITPRTIQASIIQAKTNANYLDKISKVVFSGSDLKKGISVSLTERGHCGKMFYFVLEDERK